jgi:hypothetical protein
MKTVTALVTTTALVVTALLAAAPLTAWGPTGHRVVGRIADGHLTPEAAAAVEELLGPTGLTHAGVWADDVRSDPAFRHADPWHYISIDDGETLADTARNEAGDVVEAIERHQRILADRNAPAEQRANALRFLVHFVGDIHQPLHVGRRADRGGNGILVTFFDQPSNLHAVWDSEIIDHRRLSFSELAEKLDHVSAEDVARLQAATLADWARESYDLREAVYPEDNQHRLSWEYVYHSWPVIERRLQEAGVRLAGVVNRALGKTTNERPSPER